jgi:hypothetical protein
MFVDGHMNPRRENIHLTVYFDWNVNWIFFPILNVKTMVLLLIFEEEDRNALYSSAKLQILIFFCWLGLLKMKKTSHPSLYYSNCIHITSSFSNSLEICNYIHSFIHVPLEQFVQPYWHLWWGNAICKPLR